MDCPKCGKGKIRVVTLVACGCGHHPLVCDGCAQQFNVPHTSPDGALPPDVPLEEDDDPRKAYDRLMADIGEKDPQPYEEMMRETIAGAAELFPLLEDFRASQSS